MRHIVLREFRDIETNRIMAPGQAIVTADEDRIHSLAEQGFIHLPDKVPKQEVKLATGGSEVFPKHTGGGHFELSNGERVQGKEAAVEAQKLLDEMNKGGTADDNT